MGRQAAGLQLENGTLLFRVFRLFLFAGLLAKAAVPGINFVHG